MKKKRKVAGPSMDLCRRSACQSDQLAEGIFTSADTEMSRMLASLLHTGRYLEIVSATVNPMDYTCAGTFGRDYLCAELMSKYPHWDLGIDRALVAQDKFISTELKLASLDIHRNPCIMALGQRVMIHAIDMTARRKIARILGEFSWDEAARSFAFGPGASTSQSSRRGDASYKFGAQRPQSSYNAEALVHALKRAHPLWSFDHEVVRGSRLVTVPKNAKTDRVICIEPDLNMYVQKGIGAVIRRRLNRWGLLLKPDRSIGQLDAQEYNARLALEGSATGRLATVDLSAASDSIHMEVVRSLLPPDWVGAIEQSRSPQCVLPSGELHLLRKVSSMGNGFTFELETLIFYALCQAVIELFSRPGMDRRCQVFGDDIVIATELVGPLEDVLAFYGFELNRKKTFASGPFRESCGKHYFNGVDVTPFYIRDRIDTIPRRYWAANTIRRYARLSWGLDARWKSCYDSIVAAIPPKYRVQIPDGQGDGGLIADWDEVRPSRSERHWDAWSYTDFVPRKRDFSTDGTGTLLKCLHALEATTRVPTGIDGELDAEGARILELIPSFWQLLAKSGLWSDTVDSNPPTFGKKGRAVIPQPRGWKKHTGYCHQWPSYGPWL